MADDEEHEKKLARLKELKRKVESEQDLTEEEESELEEMASDPSLPVEVAGD
jgi:hypothetical protein